MAQYAIFVYAPAPADPMDMTPEEIEGHQRFHQYMVNRGIDMSNAQALQPSTSARSVRDGAVTDGTLIDAEEVLTGFFVLEAEDLDAALEIAKQMPAKKPGGVEVRPIFVPPTE